MPMLRCAPCRIYNAVARGDSLALYAISAACNTSLGVTSAIIYFLSDRELTNPRAAKVGVVCHTKYPKFGCIVEYNTNCNVCSNAILLYSILDLYHLCL